MNIREVEMQMMDEIDAAYGRQRMVLVRASCGHDVTVFDGRELHYQTCGGLPVVCPVVLYGGEQ